VSLLSGDLKLTLADYVLPNGDLRIFFNFEPWIEKHQRHNDKGTRMAKDGED